MDTHKTRKCGLYLLSVYVLLMTIAITITRCEEADDLQSTAGLPTVTVRGFLNFKTTVGGTVIVFTPAADLPKTVENIKQTTRPIEKPSVLSTNLIVPHGNVLESRDVADPAQMQELDFTQRSDDPLQSDIIGDLVHLDHKAKAPLLQHISDNAVIPSTAHTDNDLETSSARKDSSTYNQYPTGLVTVLDGTRVQDGKTTIFETKVIGTYIDGKYAQILQSTSKIIVPKSFYTPSYRSVGSTTSSLESITDTKSIENILTSTNFVEPQSVPISKSETIATSSENSPSLTPASTSSQHPQSTISTSNNPETPIVKSQVTPSRSLYFPTPITTLRNSPITTSSRPTETTSSKSNTYMSTVTPTVTHSRASWIMKSASGKPQTNTYRPQLQSSFPSSPKLSSSFSAIEDTEKSSQQTSKRTPTLDLATPKMSTTSRTFSRSSTTTTTTDEDYETVFLKSSNLRLSSTIRTRFSAPRRPSQSVKLNRFKVKLTLRHNSTDGDMTTPSVDETMDPDDEPEDEDMSLETTTEDDLLLDVDPAHVVYHETTITSKVTLHVGRRKSIRTLTITTSVPMRISPTEDSETAMTTTPTDDLRHDNEAEENAPATHSVISRTFTSTERTHTTSVVPVFDGKQTTYHTLTESLFIMKIVTAYKTLPPTDYTVLAVPPTTEQDIEVVTENLTALDVAANVQPSIVEKLPPEQMSAAIPEILQPSIAAVPIPATNNGLGNPILSFGQALSNNPLAAVYLGLQQLNAQMTLYSTITQTSTFLTTDTIYSTKVIRFYDGRSTRYRTMSDPVSTKERIVTTTVTKVHPYINTQAYQQQQQLRKLIAPSQLPTPPQQQQFRTLTTTYTTATTATSYSTRIYTLIYNGFSTKFRTVTSSKVYPTTLTITSTKEVPVITAQPQLVPFAYPYPAAK